MKILIIEDDPDISEFIKFSMESEGNVVDTAFDGQQGSYMARTNKYDVIVLDYSLPIRNGLEVCNEIRSTGSSTPIIFLSVVADTNKKIEVLSRGADDYMTKPFYFEELKARIQALLRRPKIMIDAVIKVGELTMDIVKRTLHRGNDLVNLTRREYSLMEYLMKNPSIAVSRSMILEHVWSANSDPFSNTVEAHITNIRRKMKNGNKKDIIKNVPGRGYIIDA
jgi:DNA-binding response OmpR family regulator